MKKQVVDDGSDDDNDKRTFTHKRTIMDEMEGARVVTTNFIHGCELPFSLSEL